MKPQPIAGIGAADHFIGLDLGQARDYTAVAIVERRETVLNERDPVTWDWRRRTDYMVRWAARLPLGTPYLEVAEHVGQLLRSPEVQLMLEAGELAIAEALEQGPTLVKELRGMRVKINVAGHETYEAWREGTHDDLVLAVSLACWYANRTKRTPRP